MKFNFKEIVSALVVVCLFFTMTAVIAMDSDSKKVPSQTDTSVSLDNMKDTQDQEDTEDITVEQETVDKVTSSSEEDESTEQEPVVEDTEDEPEKEMENEPVLTEEELEWQKYLMADVEVGLNIRAEANLEAEVVGRLGKGARATILEIGEEWTKILSGEVEGYVNNAYCLFGTDALALAKEVCDTLAVCTTDNLRIREAMSTESDIAGAMEYEDALIVDTAAITEEGWVAVVYKGSTCYVSADYVNVYLNVFEALTMDEVYAIEEEKQEEERRQKEEAKRQEAIQAAQSNKAYAASVSELDLMAALIYCEAGAEPYETQLAVGAVVMNRLEKGTYGSTLADVIYQPGHFTPAGDGKVNCALENGYADESCYQAAREALAGKDNTNGALYFNDWCEALDGVGIQYGGMVFYYVWFRY